MDQTRPLLGGLMSHPFTKVGVPIEGCKCGLNPAPLKTDEATWMSWEEFLGKSP